MTIVYFALALICFFVIYIKSQQDVLHPVAIMSSVWFVTAAISSLGWGVFQHQWSIIVHINILLSGLVCLLFGCVFLSISRKVFVSNNLLDDRSYSSPINDTYILVTRLVLIVTIILAFVIFTRRGISINVLRSFSGSDKKGEISKALEDLSSAESYIVNLFPYCAIFSFFEIFHSKKGQRHIVFNVIVILLVIVYCLKVIYSRGTLLYLLLGFLYIINSKKRIPIKFLAVALIGILVVFGIFMRSRVYSGSIIYTGVDHLSNPILVSAYNYIAYSFENFSLIVEKGSRLNMFTNVFQSFYKLLGIYNPDQVVQSEVADVYNSITWLSNFYDDIGFVGTIIYPSIISILLSFFYKKSKSNKFFVLVLAVLQKPIFVVFFGNYFFTSLSVMFPYFVTGLICFLSSKINIVLPRSRYAND